jgi:hypothetical protein
MKKTGRTENPGILLGMIKKRNLPGEVGRQKALSVTLWPGEGGAVRWGNEPLGRASDRTGAIALAKRVAEARDLEFHEIKPP